MKTSKTCSAAPRNCSTQVEKTDARYTDIYEAKDKLVAGDCWAFLAYSGDAAVLVSENPDVGYFIPREGAPLWLDSFAIPKNTPNSGAAHAFIDFMSKPVMAAGNAELPLLCHRQPRCHGIPETGIALGPRHLPARGDPVTLRLHPHTAHSTTPSPTAA